LEKRANGEKQVASFVLSLVGGILILVGGVMLVAFSPIPWYYGGMMGGYHGMFSGYYGMMGLFGYWSYFAAAIGLVSGLVVLSGAIMIYTRPAKSVFWGSLILVFSVLSLFGMGGFLFGGILGMVGGLLALFTPESRTSYAV